MEQKSTVRPQPTPFLQRDDVASFTATLLMMQAMAVGTCVKFRRYGGREQLVHLNQPQTDQLIEGLESYYRHGRHTNFTYHLHYHPEEAQALPASHHAAEVQRRRGRADYPWDRCASQLAVR
jgi:hypothetical protein